MGINIEQLTASKRQLLRNGEFGLEKESLRVTPDGYLAKTPHPFPNDPKRDRDFCENQLEMITGVSHSIAEVYEELAGIHRDTVRILAMLPDGSEYLWPFSNPPYLRSEKEIPIADYSGLLAEKTAYRRYLATKYGKKKMLFSGIHFNVSFSEELLKADFENSGIASFQEYKNALYLDLAGKVVEKSWLIVYLTAASPLFDGSYEKPVLLGDTHLSPYASPRCGANGYWNNFLPALDFSSIESYVKSIQSYVDYGMLQAPSELYYPVRLKPKGVNSLEQLLEKGINHIELRMFDLNPLSEIGIDPRDLEFVYLLLLALLIQPSKQVSEEAQSRAIRNMKEAARLNDKLIQIEREGQQMEPIKDAVREELLQLEEILLPYLPEEQVRSIISNQRQKIEHPMARYATRISKEYQFHYVKKGMDLIKKRAEVLTANKERHPFHDTLNEVLR